MPPSLRARRAGTASGATRTAASTQRPPAGTAPDATETAASTQRPPGRHDTRHHADSSLHPAPARTARHQAPRGLRSAQRPPGRHDTRHHADCSLHPAPAGPARHQALRGLQPPLGVRRAGRTPGATPTAASTEHPLGRHDTSATRTATFTQLPAWEQTRRNHNIGKMKLTPAATPMHRKRTPLPRIRCAKVGHNSQSRRSGGGSDSGMRKRRMRAPAPGGPRGDATRATAECEAVRRWAYRKWRSGMNRTALWKAWPAPFSLGGRRGRLGLGGGRRRPAGGPVW
ncbi:hypothetical protein BJY16_007888 [Actinoplanes octamycinicus]|uniref:Uncharacterized protein n=1 Tax=Actinoplanes octamycinicus TaxID=135948 RepID=A0A7W7H5T4_9ACTN|nr:hypothetical protein [Actinoplanes octamycinicus]